jgi:hypothetical protein
VKKTITFGFLLIIGGEYRNLYYARAIVLG